MLIIGEFVINQDFIAKTLCIEREAQTGCNGKCQLRKSISENNSETNNEDPLQSNKRIAVEFVFIQGVSSFKFNTFHAKKSSLILNPLNDKIRSQYYDIETPPPLFS